MGTLNWSPLLTLKALEKEAIKQAVLHHSGNLTAAAEDLGIGKSTLYAKLPQIFTKLELYEIRPIKKWWE